MKARLSTRAFAQALIGVIACLAVIGASAVGFDDDAKTYIVHLIEPPVASYTGGIVGYGATRPAPGRLLDMNASHVQSYAHYLGARQAIVASAAGKVAILQQFKVTFNGFSAVLTPAQVATLRRMPGVLSVQAAVRSATQRRLSMT